MFNELLMNIAGIHSGFTVVGFKKKTHAVLLSRSKPDYSVFCVTFCFGWLLVDTIPELLEPHLMQSHRKMPKQIKECKECERKNILDL